MVWELITGRKKSVEPLVASPSESETESIVDLTQDFEELLAKENANNFLPPPKSGINLIGLELGISILPGVRKNTPENNLEKSSRVSNRGISVDANAKIRANLDKLSESWDKKNSFSSTSRVLRTVSFKFLSVLVSFLVYLIFIPINRVDSITRKLTRPITIVLDRHLVEPIKRVLYNLRKLFVRRFARRLNAMKERITCRSPIGAALRNASSCGRTKFCNLFRNGRNKVIACNDPLHNNSLDLSDPFIGPLPKPVHDKLDYFDGDHFKSDTLFKSADGSFYNIKTPIRDGEGHNIGNIKPVRNMNPLVSPYSSRVKRLMPRSFASAYEYGIKIQSKRSVQNHRISILVNILVSGIYNLFTFVPRNIYKSYKFLKYHYNCAVSNLRMYRARTTKFVWMHTYRNPQKFLRRIYKITIGRIRQLCCRVCRFIMKLPVVVMVKDALVFAHTQVEDYLAQRLNFYRHLINDHVHVPLHCVSFTARQTIYQAGNRVSIKAKKQVSKIRNKCPNVNSAQSSSQSSNKAVPFRLSGAGGNGFVFAPSTYPRFGFVGVALRAVSSTIKCAGSIRRAFRLSSISRNLRGMSMNFTTLSILLSFKKNVVNRLIALRFPFRNPSVSSDFIGPLLPTQYRIVARSSCNKTSSNSSSGVDVTSSSEVETIESEEIEDIEDHNFSPSEENIDHDNIEDDTIEDEYDCDSFNCEDDSLDEELKNIPRIPYSKFILGGSRGHPWIGTKNKSGSYNINGSYDYREASSKKLRNRMANRMVQVDLIRRYAGVVGFLVAFLSLALHREGPFGNAFRSIYEKHLQKSHWNPKPRGMMIDWRFEQKPRESSWTSSLDYNNQTDHRTDCELHPITFEKLHHVCTGRYAVPKNAMKYPKAIESPKKKSMAREFLAQPSNLRVKQQRPVREVQIWQDSNLKSLFGSVHSADLFADAENKVKLLTSSGATPYPSGIPYPSGFLNTTKAAILQRARRALKAKQKRRERKMKEALTVVQERNTVVKKNRFRKIVTENAKSGAVKFHVIASQPQPSSVPVYNLVAKNMTESIDLSLIGQPLSGSSALSVVNMQKMSTPSRGIPNFAMKPSLKDMKAVKTVKQMEDVRAIKQASSYYLTLNKRYQDYLKMTPKAIAEGSEFIKSGDHSPSTHILMPLPGQKGAHLPPRGSRYDIEYRMEYKNLSKDDSDDEIAFMVEMKPFFGKGTKMMNSMNSTAVISTSTRIPHNYVERKFSSHYGKQEPYGKQQPSAGKHLSVVTEPKTIFDEDIFESYMGSLRIADVEAKIIKDSVRQQKAFQKQMNHIEINKDIQKKKENIKSSVKGLGKGYNRNYSDLPAGSLSRHESLSGYETMASTTLLGAGELFDELNNAPPVLKGKGKGINLSVMNRPRTPHQDHMPSSHLQLSELKLSKGVGKGHFVDSDSIDTMESMIGTMSTTSSDAKNQETIPNWTSRKIVMLNGEKHEKGFGKGPHGKVAVAKKLDSPVTKALAGQKKLSTPGQSLQHDGRMSNMIVHPIVLTAVNEIGNIADEDSNKSGSRMMKKRDVIAARKGAARLRQEFAMKMKKISDKEESKIAFSEIPKVIRRNPFDEEAKNKFQFWEDVFKFSTGVNKFPLSTITTANVLSQPMFSGSAMGVGASTAGVSGFSAATGMSGTSNFSNQAFTNLKTFNIGNNIESQKSFQSQASNHYQVEHQHPLKRKLDQFSVKSYPETLSERKAFESFNTAENQFRLAKSLGFSNFLKQKSDAKTIVETTIESTVDAVSSIFSTIKNGAMCLAEMCQAVDMEFWRAQRCEETEEPIMNRPKVSLLEKLSRKVKGQMKNFLKVYGPKLEYGPRMWDEDVEYECEYDEENPCFVDELYDMYGTDNRDECTAGEYDHEVLGVCGSSDDSTYKSSSNFDSPFAKAYYPTYAEFWRPFFQTAEDVVNTRSESLADFEMYWGMSPNIIMSLNEDELLLNKANKTSRSTNLGRDSTLGFQVINSVIQELQEIDENLYDDLGKILEEISAPISELTRKVSESFITKANNNLGTTKNKTNKKISFRKAMLAKKAKMAANFKKAAKKAFAKVEKKITPVEINTPKVIIPTPKVIIPTPVQDSSVEGQLRESSIEKKNDSPRNLQKARESYRLLNMKGSNNAMA